LKPLGCEKHIRKSGNLPTWSASFWN
jgi:hypothetical protein